MRSIGSLYQFMDPSRPLLEKSESDQEKNIYYKQLTKAQLKQNRLNNPRRYKTSLDQYQPSNKNHIIRYLTQQEKQKTGNYSKVLQSLEVPLSRSRQRDLADIQDSKYLKQITSRYKRSRYKGGPIRSILLPKRAQIIELQTKNKYNIDQGLLRALQKIKVTQNRQKRKTKKYQQSFLSYSQALSKLKLAPIQRGYQKEQQLSTSHHLIIRTKRSKTDLSDTKRIQFERCLSWAKKHHKDGHYYQKQLGKEKVENNWGNQVKKRRKMLTALGDKYGASARASGRLYKMD